LLTSSKDIFKFLTSMLDFIKNFIVRLFEMFCFCWNHSEGIEKRVKALENKVETLQNKLVITKKPQRQFLVRGSDQVYGRIVNITGERLRQLVVLTDRGQVHAVVMIPFKYPAYLNKRITAGSLVLLDLTEPVNGTCYIIEVYSEMEEETLFKEQCDDTTLKRWSVKGIDYSTEFYQNWWHSINGNSYTRITSKERFKRGCY
jgi:hypothetical protein